MKNRFKMRICVLFFSTALYANAQSIKDSSIFAPIVCASYGALFPEGDLANRFGWHSSLDLQVLVKTKSNWLFGINGSYLFGNEVRENNMFANITTPDGFFISSGGTFSDKILLMRGFSGFLKFGKLFPVLNPNPNSGIVAMGGVGFMLHKIRIELIDGDATTVPQMSEELQKGYDRLSYGIAFHQFVGYLFLSNNRITNFFAGFEFNQGFTQNQRYNIDQNAKDNSTRFDFQYGIRAGWVLPLYKKPADKFYTY